MQLIYVGNVFKFDLGFYRLLFTICCVECWCQHDYQNRPKNVFIFL